MHHLSCSFSVSTWALCFYTLSMMINCWKKELTLWKSNSVQWKYWITLHVTCIEFNSNTLSLCSCAGVFLCWPSLSCPQRKTSHQFKFLLVTFRFETFDRSMSHLGIFFEDVDQTTLLLNNHIKLNAQETLKMLNLFGLKITFAMKIKFILKF